MRFPIRSGGARHRRRTSRLIPAAGLVLALAGVGLSTDASLADESPSKPELLVPEGYEVVDADADADADNDGAGAEPRIIGGTDTAFSDAPFMVQLLFDRDRDGSYYFTCGGTLVAPNKVLTAAHCLHDENGVRQDWGRYGAILAGTNKLLGGWDNAEGTFVDVTRSWVRGTYDHHSADNDIAVLTLAEPVNLRTTEIADLGDDALYAPGTAGTAYGWGMTSADRETGTLASTLQRVSLPLHSDAECAANLDSVLGAGSFEKGHMVCAGPPGTGDDATGRTTCPGDSGGPLLVRGKVAGVVSWGIGTDVEACNVSGSYEVFTKVKTYAPTVEPRVNDTDLSRDGKADLFVRSASTGTGYLKKSTGSGFLAREKLTGSWSAYDVALQADMNQDGHQDFILRRRSDGDVFWRHRTPGSATWIDTRIADDWSTRKFLVAPGDVTGDRFPDLLSVTSGGTLYVYPGNGKGGYGSRITGGTGYSGYTSLRGKGDYSLDGRADLIARAKDGSVHLLRGTGKGTAPFATRVKVRDWAGYNAFAAPGDVTADGIADHVARTPGGTLYLYPGTGKAGSGIFATRIRIGTGYEQYNLWG
ncbi:trypsin-like serine protease [Streptomyces macrosporus]|uniref:Peptidase S1 domain-containing protein n=1 Tax=Streptomyces macrosporus TaxID=44032 RepID=A0ABN3J905_9ACTN